MNFDKHSKSSDQHHEVNREKMEPSFQTNRRVFEAPPGRFRPTPKLTRQKRLREIRRCLYERDGRCFYCKKRFERFEESTLDHLKPRAKGGTDSIHNLLLACVPCNRAKADFESNDEARARAQAQREKDLFATTRRAGASGKMLGDPLHRGLPARREPTRAHEPQPRLEGRHVPPVPGAPSAPSRREPLTVPMGTVWYHHTLDELIALASA